MPLEPLHVRIIRIAAELPEARTIALAGGGSMLAHDIVERATRDVDLFTDRDPDEAAVSPLPCGTCGGAANLATTSMCSRSWVSTTTTLSSRSRASRRPSVAWRT